jgi:nitroimidazol reductase NimA-like FMN-containing flavoprotein (pyridoxamine 5'-phosphate oxidase superfamily)
VKTLIISELSREKSIGLLSRCHVGRLAFGFHDRVDIEPISYVYDDEWIYARTSPGTKLTTVRHHPWVAFEVDDVKGRYDWQSVVVRGTIYFIEPSRGLPDAEEYERAVEILRSVDRHAMTKADDAPHRQAIFRIHADEIIGRQATSG